MLPPQPKVIDLDDVICKAGEIINEITGKILQPDDTEAQRATTIQRIQLPPEELAQIYDPTLPVPGPHPTVVITDEDQKKGERI